MRISHITHNATWHGQWIHVVDTTEEQVRRGHPSTVLVTNWQLAAPQLAAGVEEVGLPVRISHLRHFIPFALHLRYIRQSLDIVRRTRPDVVLLHNPNNHLLIRALADEHPVVVYIHATGAFCPTGEYICQTTGDICSRHAGNECYPCLLAAGMKPSRFSFLLDETDALADACNDPRVSVICASHYMKKFLTNQGVEEKQITVNAPFFKPLATDTSVQRDESLVLYVGAITEKKGVPHLLEAMSRLPDLRLRLIGPYGDSPAPSIERWLRAPELAGRVEVLPPMPQSHIAEHYDEAAVLAFSSVWPEPFGRTGLEALGRGLPVVAFDCGGVPDWLDHGKSGYLVPRGDIAAYAEALLQVVSDRAQWEGFSRYALDTVPRRFSADAFFQRYLPVLERTGEQRRSQNFTTGLTGLTSSAQIADFAGAPADLNSDPLEAILLSDVAKLEGVLQHLAAVNPNCTVFALGMDEEAALRRHDVDYLNIHDLLTDDECLAVQYWALSQAVSWHESPSFREFQIDGVPLFAKIKQQVGKELVRAVYLVEGIERLLAKGLRVLYVESQHFDTEAVLGRFQGRGVQPFAAPSYDGSEPPRARSPVLDAGRSKVPSKGSASARGYGASSLRSRVARLLPRWAIAAMPEWLKGLGRRTLDSLDPGARRARRAALSSSLAPSGRTWSEYDAVETRQLIAGYRMFNCPLSRGHPTLWRDPEDVDWARSVVWFDRNLKGFARWSEILPAGRWQDRAGEIVTVGENPDDLSEWQRGAEENQYRAVPLTAVDTPDLLTRARRLRRSLEGKLKALAREESIWNALFVWNGRSVFPLVNRELRRRMRQTARDVLFPLRCSEFLRKHSPKRIYVRIDTLMDLVIPTMLAGKYGLKTYVIQHGAMVGPFPFFPMRAHRSLVWGEVSKEWMVARGADPERIVPIGSAAFERLMPHHEEVMRKPFKFLRFKSRRQRMVVVATSPDNLNIPTYSMKRTFQTIEWVLEACRGREDIYVAIKVHPGEKEETYHGYTHNGRFVPVYKGPMRPFLDHAKVWVTAHSTTGWEAILCGVPTAVVNPGGGMDLFPHVQEGAAAGFSEKRPFIRWLQRVLDNREEYWAEWEPVRKRFVERAFVNGNIGAEERLADVIKNGLDEEPEKDALSVHGQQSAAS